MLFSTDTDRHLFLFELGKSPDNKDSADDHSTFVKRRAQIVPMLKSFRKQQDSKHAWSRNPTKFLFALRRWHHSPAGRRAHHKLNRFLVTKELRQRSDLFSRDESIELAKLLQQELQYYRSLTEQVELEVLIDMLGEMGLEYVR